MFDWTIAQLDTVPLAKLEAGITSCPVPHVIVKSSFKHPRLRESRW